MKCSRAPIAFVLAVASVSFVGCASDEQAAAPKASANERYTYANQYAKPGFTAFTQDGRLWVFQNGSKELSEFSRTGDLAKRVTFPAQGPGGMTIKGPDRETVLAYLATKDGFTAMAEDGRVWVYRNGSDELRDAKMGLEPAKHVSRIGRGPMRSTLRATDAATLDAWARAN